MGSEVVSLKDLLNQFEELNEKLLMWPFSCTSDDKLFSEKTISLLKDTSQAVEKHRFRKNVGVISGATTGVIGAGTVVAAVAATAVVPFVLGFGLVVVGPVLSMGFIAGKYIRDKAKRKIVTQDLENFKQIQFDLVLTFNFTRLAFQMTETLQDFAKVQAGIDTAGLFEKFEDIKNDVDKFHEMKSVKILDRIHHLNDYASKLCVNLVEVLDLLSRKLSSKPTKFRTEIRLAEAKPFEALGDSVSALVNVISDAEKKGNRQITFGRFVLKLYDLIQEYGEKGHSLSARATLATEDPDKDTIPANKKKSILKRLPTSDENDGSEDIFEIDEGLEEAIRTTKNILKGVATAGLAIGAVGLIGDLCFLGSAAVDLAKMGKEELEELSKALVDVAGAMEKLNMMLSPIPE